MISSPSSVCSCTTSRHCEKVKNVACHLWEQCLDAKNLNESLAFIGSSFKETPQASGTRLDFLSGSWILSTFITKFIKKHTKNQPSQRTRSMKGLETRQINNLICQQSVLINTIPKHRTKLFKTKYSQRPESVFIKSFVKYMSVANHQLFWCWVQNICRHWWEPNIIYFQLAKTLGQGISSKLTILLYLNIVPLDSSAILNLDETTKCGQFMPTVWCKWHGCHQVTHVLQPKFFK